MEGIKIDLLRRDEIVGPNALDVMKNCGPLAAMTDFAIGTGGRYKFGDATYNVNDDGTTKRRAGVYYTSTNGANNRENNYIICADASSKKENISSVIQVERYPSIRPVLELPEELFEKLKAKARKSPNGTYFVLFGEYPQWAPNHYEQDALDGLLYGGEVRETNHKYTINNITVRAEKTYPFSALTLKELTVVGNKYVRVVVKQDESQLNRNGEIEFWNLHCEQNKEVWYLVSPIAWLLDFENKRLISKRCLISGIRFNGGSEQKPLSETEMYNYLNNFMLPEILQSVDMKELEAILPKMNINVTTEAIDNIESQLKDSDLSKEELELLKSAIELEKEEAKTIQSR